MVGIVEINATAENRHLGRPRLTKRGFVAGTADLAFRDTLRD